MLPYDRQHHLRILHESRNDIELCLETEARCHALTTSVSDYHDLILRCAHSLRLNSSLGKEVAMLTDAETQRGTILEDVENERKQRRQRFEEMLQEKFESMDDETFKSIVTCRVCGSNDVQWEEKQTRSADEGATVFCTCIKCKNRWVMR